MSPNMGFSIQLCNWATARPTVAKARTLVYRIELSDSCSWSCWDKEGEDENQSPLALASGPLVEITSELFSTHPSNANGEVDLASAENTTPNGDAANRTNSNQNACLLLCPVVNAHQPISTPESQHQYIWYRKSASAPIKLGAKKVSEQLRDLENAPKSVIWVEAGREPPEFWHLVNQAKAQGVILSPTVRQRSAMLCKKGRRLSLTLSNTSSPRTPAYGPSTTNYP